MSSVNDFLNAISIAGVQRAHRWQVRVSFPAQLATTDTMRKIDLFARTATTPASTIGDLGLRFSGRAVPVAGDRAFEDFTMTFLGTNDYAVYDSFTSWSELINGNESNTGLVSPNSYMADVELDLLDQANNVTKSYVLKSAWPLNVSGSELDKGSENTVTEFSVTWKFLNVVTDNTR